MTESGFWIGVEAMPLSVLRAAAEHERPIFCGRLSLDNTLQAELGDVYKRADWHDVALNTAIGQGYLMDLLRQSSPVASVVLALDVSTDTGLGDGGVAPVDQALAHARRIIEGLLVVTRAAEAVMPAGGGSLTVVLHGPSQASCSLAEGMAAFVAQFVSSEAARWAEEGRSLGIERTDSDE